jgi:DNA-binding NarL/FixJ family response regulator
MNRVQILLADDHPLVCDGLRALLASQPDLEVVGAVSDGRDAIRATRELHPDVLIIDIAMPGLNGIEAAERIHREHPEVRIIMLSMHDSSEHVYRAVKAGASGYLLKESAGREVVDAIRSVRAGKRYLSQRIAALPALEERLNARDEASPVESLSPREREILQLVVEGNASSQIATLVGLSPKTVETYRSRMMQKLGLPDLPALVKFAIQHGLTGIK